MAVCPEQIVELPEIAAFAEKTATEPEASAVHPLAETTVTEYPVVTVGETIIVLVVAPLLHAYVPPPEALSV